MFCPACGERCGDGDRFCRSCGKPLLQDSEAQSDGAADSPGVTEADQADADSLLARAASGDATAQAELGAGLLWGKDGFEKNSQRGRFWLEKAAEQGDASAQCNLGLMYDNGEGVPELDAEAVRWYRLAAEQDYADAQYNLGLMYENGEGVAQSDTEAIHWFRLAAEHGDVDAQHHLGDIYDDGRGVEQSREDACHWYRLAAEQGDGEAQDKLRMLCRDDGNAAQDDCAAVTLWSTLIQNSWRREFNCPDELVVSNELFAAELASAIEQNHIPAKISLREVTWDDIGKRQKRILVRYTGRDAVTDVLQYMVGVDQMGRFSYVEEKTYFAEPSLPTSPRKKKDVPRDNRFLGGVLLVLGIAVGSLGSVGLQCFAAIGVFMGILGLAAVLQAWGEDKDIEGVMEWNKKADSEAEARKRAWEEWERSILAVGYLARTDDTLGRFIQAVRSTVAQVTQKLFVDRNAELVKETEQESTQEEIKAELAKRRKEAFG